METTGLTKRVGIQLSLTKITDKNINNTEGLSTTFLTLASYMKRHVSLNSGQVGL